MPADPYPIAPLAERIVAFGRVLRRVGLAVGPGEIVEALRAVDVVGVGRRDDVYQALFSVFVWHRSHVDLFDEAFELFWRAPVPVADAEDIFLSRLRLEPPADGPRARVRRALGDGRGRPKPPPEGGDEAAAEGAAAYSAVEAFRSKDFAAFTAEEVAAAQAFLRQLRWPVPLQTTRRPSPREKGRWLQVRQTLRRSLRHHGEVLELYLTGRRRKTRPLVVLCDVSGSMEPYVRMLLHFTHAVTGGMQRVETFVFGTRLTRITRHLRRRDVDEAVEAVSGAVDDWGGGTRIGEALRAFNYDWLRRVLRSRGVVLVISDGCDRGDPTLLAREMARLARSSHRVIWLNPLLGYEHYEPLTRGMQAALPYVDDFLPVHNLASLEQLGRLLSGLSRRRFGGARGTGAVRLRG